MKAEILAAIELAGEEGIQGDELAQLLPDVAPATMNATLSVLRRDGLVSSRRTGLARKSIWYRQTDEDERGAEGATEERPKVTTGRHGVSLPAISI